MPDFSRLDAHLENAGLGGYLIDADASVSDQRYLSGYDAPDPYFTLYTPDELGLLVSGLEYGRARRESAGDTVRRYADYDYSDNVEKHGSTEARRMMVAEFVADMGVESVAVPKRFPVDTADGLRERDVAVTPDRDDVITQIRARKDESEIDHVRRAQRANEAAMRAAEQLLAEAVIDGGDLRYDDEPLTAERVKQEIEMTLLRHGCGLDETIVAGGEQGADPHDRGHGPLPAGDPIVIDIFPRDKETKYHADMTRTLVRGDPSDAVRDRHELTETALDAALAAIEPGATGADVHDAACDVYENAGYPTLRSDPRTETGYIHSTGHGVGLDIHERPRLSPDGEELEPGHVVTVEPGLYDPAVGGMRIEDLVVVTEDGHDNLTDYPRRLVVE